MTRTRRWAVLWETLRLLAAGLILAAIIAQLTKSVVSAHDGGRDVVTTAANFFSFFTILSNTASVVVLAWAAIWYFARGRSAQREPAGLAVALASVSTYMIITGVVYNTLLRGIELPQGSAPIPWSNEVLHVVGPIILLLDVFVGPLRRPLPWKAVWAVIAFPIAWVAYTLVRGPLVTNPITTNPWWYPYPFLDPHNFATGYLGVSLYVAMIAAGIVAVGFFVIWIGRRRTEDASAPEAVEATEGSASA